MQPNVTRSSVVLDDKYTYSFMTVDWIRKISILELLF